MSEAECAGTGCNSPDDSSKVLDPATGEMTLDAEKPDAEKTDVKVSAKEDDLDSPSASTDKPKSPRNEPEEDSSTPGPPPTDEKSGQSSPTSATPSSGVGASTSGHAANAGQVSGWDCVKCVFCDQDICTPNPKLMLCLHTTCSACFFAKTSDQEAKADVEVVERNLICPKCKVCTPFDCIIENQFLRETLSEQGVHSDESGNSGSALGGTGVPSSVTSCSCEDNAPVTSWCVECADYLCDGCVHAHQRVKVTKDHMIKSKEEARTDCGQIGSGAGLNLFCSVHKQEKLSLFCETCDKLTCRDCQLTDHREHRYKFINEIALDLKMAMKKLLGDVKFKRDLLEGAQAVIRKRQATIGEKKREAVQDITDMVLSLTNAIRSRGKQLMQHLNEICEMKQQKLMEKEAAISDLSQQACHSIEFIDAALQSGSDIALLFCKKTLVANLQRIKQTQMHVPNPDIPVRIQLMKESLPKVIYVLNNVCHVEVDGRAYPPRNAAAGGCATSPSNNNNNNNNSSSSAGNNGRPAQQNRPLLPAQQQFPQQPRPPPPSYTQQQQQQQQQQLPQQQVVQMTPGLRQLQQQIHQQLRANSNAQQQQQQQQHPQQQQMYTANQVSSSTHPTHIGMYPPQQVGMASSTNPALRTAQEYQLRAMASARGVVGGTSVLASHQSGTGQVMSPIQPGQPANQVAAGAVHQSGGGQVFGTIRLHQGGAVGPSVNAGAARGHGGNASTVVRSPNVQVVPSPSWHIPQPHGNIVGNANCGGALLVGSMSPSPPVMDNSFKITIKAANHQDKSPSQSPGAASSSSSQGSNPIAPPTAQQVTSSGSRGTPSPLGLGLVADKSAVGEKSNAVGNGSEEDPEKRLDKFCQESVNDLMATIARLSDIGVTAMRTSAAGGGGNAPNGAAGGAANGRGPGGADSSTEEQHNVTIMPQGRVGENTSEYDPDGTGSARVQNSPTGKDDPNEDWCAVCMDGGDLICCERCPKVFHPNCHVPALREVPQEAWQCALCTPLHEVLNTPVPPGSKRPRSMDARDRRIAQRILLELYCQYESSLPFRELVSPELCKEYYLVIKKPMALDLLKAKLDPRDSHQYTNLEEFLSDVRLMFRNAFTFNEKGSSVYQDAKALEEFFDHFLQKSLTKYAFDSVEDDDDNSSDGPSTSGKRSRKTL